MSRHFAPYAREPVGTLPAEALIAADRASGDGNISLPDPADGRLQQAALARRVQRKMIADGCLLLLFVLLACSISASIDELLRNAAIATAVGIIVFLLRRRRDFAALARADRWRSDAVRGRGISLQAWHTGENLPPWSERRD